MAQQWINTELLAESISEDEPKSVMVEGLEIALYRINDEVFATSNICTHGQARLCEGYLENYEIECPLHQGRFDIRSGKALCAPVTVDVRCYPAKVQGGSVWLDLAE